MQRVNLGFLKKCWTIAKPYWFSEEKWKAWGLLLLLVASLLANSLLFVVNNYQQRELMSSLADKDTVGFIQAVLISAAMLLLLNPVVAFITYLERKIALNWRTWMTNRYLNQYFSDRRFYKINQIENIDNPDQRISEDIKTYSERGINIVVQILRATIQLITFSGVLWLISKQMSVFIYVYVFSGSILVIYVFGKILVSLYFNQSKREANFRFGLVRVRDNAESIAFYGGEEQEKIHLDQRFKEVVSNQNKLINWQAYLDGFQELFDRLTYLLPMIILGPQILAGQLDIGIVTQAQGALGHIFHSIKLIVNQFDLLSAFAAGIARLDPFGYSLDIQTTGRTNELNTTIDRLEHNQLALEKLTLYTPNYHRILVEDLSVEVLPGKGLLIVGSSGSGKSSLLRAIAGLWNSGTGAIARPKLEEILFLPQRPYMILGSLRDQLLYPHNPKGINDKELYQLLEHVNLADLPERFGGFDVEEDWENVLSLGEQQRLAFARLLLGKPRYALLDEATSGLDIQNEARLYKHLLETSMTFISVGHNPTLLKYHHQVLELTGDKKWQLIPTKRYTFMKIEE